MREVYERDARYWMKEVKEADCRGIFCCAKEHSWKLPKKWSRLVERDAIREVGTVPSDVT